MIKLGYPLAFLVLISMVIPASAQNISDEDAKIREEILACFAEVDANEDLTVAEKTVAKRNCETKINNEHSDMNNNHHDLADEKDRIQVIQKCEDWYPSYKILDEEQWKIQKYTDHAADCLMLYNDDVWDYDGKDRLIILSDRLLELKEEQYQRPAPVATSIQIPSQSSIIAQDTRSDKMTQLEDKVAELEEQIRKKDAVIMEQMRVITDLANMIRNVILGAFTPSDGLF
ncbi:MAG: hypothetical protein ACE5RT_05070 [Nitrosopumilaceae archaeon]